MTAAVLWSGGPSVSMVTLIPAWPYAVRPSWRAVFDYLAADVWGPSGFSTWTNPLYHVHC